MYRQVVTTNRILRWSALFSALSSDLLFLAACLLGPMSASRAMADDTLTILTEDDPPMNFVENGERIERAESRFEVLRGQPDGVAIGLARLRAPGLSHVRA